MESNKREIDKVYTELGYARELREEYTDDTFRCTREFRDNNLVLTHYVRDRALFTEYYDTERKVWVYERV